MFWAIVIELPGLGLSTQLTWEAELGITTKASLCSGVQPNSVLWSPAPPTHPMALFLPRVPLAQELIASTAEAFPFSEHIQSKKYFRQVNTHKTT